MSSLINSCHSACKNIKYTNNESGEYEYSLGLNGLGACATQYSSEYMDVTVWRDGKTRDYEVAMIEYNDIY